MTPEERNLLIAVARRVSVAVGWDGQCKLGQLADAVEKGAPAPIAPRAKYVRVEHATGATQFNCQSCGDSAERLVRLGDYYDPSFLCCQTCIREAAALLSIIE